MNDGGVTALSGFLYQLLGSAAGLSQAANDDLAVLHLEPSGEDALLSLASGKTLVQFKYSAGGREIAPAELAGILSKLEEHSGDSSCTWKLSTNRPFSPAVQQLLLDRPSDPKLLKNVGLENRCVITRLIKRLTRVPLTFSDLYRQLSTRCREFGLTAEEIERGADRLVGAMVRLVRERGAGVAIRHAFLDKQLVGFPDPGRLHGPSRKKDVAATLDELARSLDGPSLKDAIPRRALERVFESLDDPVVVVTGPGGCGKTLSVLRAIADHVDARGVLGGMLVSDRNQSLEALVASWRSPSQFQNPERLQMVMERLLIANAGHGGLILILGLDGLDEHGWRSSNRIDHIRELVMWVRESRLQAPVDIPALKLIFTCRDKREIDDLLAESGVGGGSRPDNQEVRLDVFDDVELRRIWSKWFSHLAFPPWAESAENQDLELLLEAGRAVTALDEQVAQALRQPTMLGCFRRLGADQQLGLLTGDEAAWHALLQSYLKWFTRKVSRRRNLPQDVARGMISACARKTFLSSGKIHDRENEWVAPAVDFSGRAKADAVHLFEDAVATGIVVTDAGNYRVSERLPVAWGWRYAFVEEYLGTLA